MAKKTIDKALPHAADRKKNISMDAVPLVSLKELRKSANQTQEDLATALAVGQDTISRLEKRSDMLLSTLRHYVESVGGQLALLATFPDQPPVIIDPLGKKKKKVKKRSRNQAVADRAES